jgi:small subunit ribosomal protein S3Ae
MAEEKKKISKDKRRVAKPWREKVWYEVFAPQMFGGTKLGDSPAAEPSHLIGRVFETTLGDLLDDVSKSTIKLYFQVKSIEDKKAITTFIGHEMVRDYIQSQIRRRCGKANNIVLVTTKDGYKMRLTSMVMALRNVQSSKVHAIRNVMRDVVVAKGSERTFEQFVQEVVLGKLSSDIYKEAKRYCPIRRVEVFKSKVVSEPA